MNELKMAVPCLFGLEGIAGDELRRMGMENVQVEDRRVLFTGDTHALAKANICPASPQDDGQGVLRNADLRCPHRKG